MIPEQIVEYTAAARISEIEGRWTMTQVFLLIHSGLFSVALTQFKLGTPFHVLTCALGASLALIWLGSTRRARALIEFWERKLGALEDLQPEPPVRVFSVQPPETAGVRIGTVLNVLVLTFVVVWLGLLTISVAPLVKTL